MGRSATRLAVLLVGAGAVAAAASKGQWEGPVAPEGPEDEAVAPEVTVAPEGPEKEPEDEEAFAPEGPAAPEVPVAPEGPEKGTADEEAVAPEGTVAPEGLEDEEAVAPEGPEKGPEDEETVALEGPVAPEGPEDEAGPVAPEGPFAPEGPEGPVAPEGPEVPSSTQPDAVEEGDVQQVSEPTNASSDTGSTSAPPPPLPPTTTMVTTAPAETTKHPDLPTTLTTTHAATTKHVFSLLGGVFYLNLPIDNWSMLGSLRTEWRALRIQGIPQIGHSSVIVDLHDGTFATSNGQLSIKRNVTNVEWGIAEDCGNSGSSMSVNLVGTPFAFEPTYPVAVGAEATGTVSCGTDSQLCAGTCGGWCGYCGLGQAGRTQSAVLHVIDQQQYDQSLLTIFNLLFGAVQTTTITTTSTTVTTTTRTTTTWTTTTATKTATATTTTATMTTTTTTATTTTTTQPALGLFGGVMGFLSLTVALAAGFGLCVAHRRGALPGWLDKLRAYSSFQEDADAGRDGPSTPPPRNIGTPYAAPKPPPLPSWARKLAGGHGEPQDSGV